MLRAFSLADGVLLFLINPVCSKERNRAISKYIFEVGGEWRARALKPRDGILVQTGAGQIGEVDAPA